VFRLWLSTEFGPTSYGPAFSLDSRQYILRARVTWTHIRSTCLRWRQQLILWQAQRQPCTPPTPTSYIHFTHDFYLLSSHAETYRLLFFRSVSHASVKSTKFSRRYQIVRLSEGNEIWHIGSPDFSVYHEIGELWPRESPWGAKILKGVKQFCSAFLVHRLAKRDEIWQG